MGGIRGMQVSPELPFSALKLETCGEARAEFCFGFGKQPINCVPKRGKSNVATKFTRPIVRHSGLLAPGQRGLRASDFAGRFWRLINPVPKRERLERTQMIPPLFHPLRGNWRLPQRPPLERGRKAAKAAILRDGIGGGLETRFRDRGVRSRRGVPLAVGIAMPPSST